MAKTNTHKTKSIAIRKTDLYRSFHARINLVLVEGAAIAHKEYGNGCKGYYFSTTNDTSATVYFSIKSCFLLGALLGRIPNFLGARIQPTTRR